MTKPHKLEKLSKSMFTAKNKLYQAHYDGNVGHVAECQSVVCNLKQQINDLIGENK